MDALIFVQFRWATAHAIEPLGQVSSAAQAPRGPVDYRAMNGPSFRFRLERVRALRERREDAAKQELAGALMRHRRCEEEVQAAAGRIASARAAQVDATRLPISFAKSHKAFHGCSIGTCINMNSCCAATCLTTLFP